MASSGMFVPRSLVDSDRRSCLSFYLDMKELNPLHFSWYLPYPDILGTLNMTGKTYLTVYYIMYGRRLKEIWFNKFPM